MARQRKKQVQLSDGSEIQELLSKITEIAEVVQLMRAKTGKVKRTRKREPRIGFNLLIPHKLYAKLKNYVDFYADKGESMTQIILAGLEKELNERYARKATQQKQA